MSLDGNSWAKAHQIPFAKSDLEGHPDPQLRFAVSDARPNEISCPEHLKAACTQTQGTIGHWTGSEWTQQPPNWVAWDLRVHGPPRQRRQGWAKALGAIEPSYPSGRAGNQPDSREERLIPWGHSVSCGVERGFGGTIRSRREGVQRGLKFRKSVYWLVCILVWRQRG